MFLLSIFYSVFGIKSFFFSSSLFYYLIFGLSLVAESSSDTSGEESLPWVCFSFADPDDFAEMFQLSPFFGLLVAVFEPDC